MSSEPDNVTINPDELKAQCYWILSQIADGNFDTEAPEFETLKTDVEKALILLTFRAVTLGYLSEFLFEYQYETNPEMSFDWQDGGWTVDDELVPDSPVPSNTEVRDLLKKVNGSKWLGSAGRICTEFDNWVLKQLPPDSPVRENLKNAIAKASGAIAEMEAESRPESRLPPKPNTVKRSKLK